MEEYNGIPKMPADFWNYMKSIEPPLKMGKYNSATKSFYAKTWRVLFTGAPGSGKSVSMAWLTAAQYLLRGIPVYAIPETYYIKVPIIWKGRIYVFESQPLDIERLINFDPALQGTCIVADEANIQLADSMRASANRNLFIADYVQQARHYGVSMLYTTILSNWLDPRLQKLTDVKIWCVDGENTDEGIEEGEYCFWYLTDESGALTKMPYTMNPISYNWIINLKQYWRITDSYNLTDNMKTRQNVAVNKEKITVGDNPNKPRIDAIEGMVDSALTGYINRTERDENGRILMPIKEFMAGIGAENNNFITYHAHEMLRQSGITRVTKKGEAYYDLTPFLK